ncbi:MAG: hypothetical protein ACFFEO_14415 [Candidatus Thorarchaeota archaeon]
MTIVINAVFYILTGYLGQLFDVPITEYFFFYILIIFYFLIVVYIGYRETRTGEYVFFISRHLTEAKNNTRINFSLAEYVKKLLTSNKFFLILFLALVCVLNVVRVSIFAGTDPWLHIFNSKIITELNYIPFENYHGTMGLNIFESVIVFFSDVNHIIVPRYFVFYTFFVSSLIFYNLTLRIFKNQNLALFSVFILEFSSLGFSIMMLQYWPSGFALILLLMVFFLLYMRLQKFIGEERPTRKIIFSEIYLTYILVALIFLSALLTHIITSSILLISFFWIYLIYFLKDRKRGIDFLFLCLLLGVTLILIYYGIGTSQFSLFIPVNLPLYLLMGVGTVGILVGVLLLWKLQKSVIFTKGRYKSAILGKTTSFHKKIEEKVIIPLIFSATILLTIIMLILNILWLNFEPINIFNIIEIFIFSSFAIWGLILFQKKPRGKPLYLWGLGLALLLTMGFILNMIIISYMIWQRILYLVPPIIVIGFVSYVYKLIRLHSIQLTKMKVIILFIITFSLFTTYFNESVSHDVFNLKKREVNIINWHTNYTSNQSVILTEFGWGYIFNYYDYPFYNKTDMILYNGNIYISANTINLFPPDNHINGTGVNLLKKIKNDYNSDLYIIFEDDYVINNGLELFGRLTQEERELYYDLFYINKICSSKTESGEEIPLFWVI